MRLLIECSYVFDHYQVNSGIQRVVRNIIGNLGACEDVCETVPVLLKNDRVYKVNRLAPVWPDVSLMQWRDSLEKNRNAYWRWHARLEALSPFRASRNMRRALFVLFKLLSIFYMIPFAILLAVESRYVNKERAVPLDDIRAGDVLVLLDSSWHADFFNVVTALKQRGVVVVSVIYDLIPLTHPQFCDAGLVVVFKEWFSWISKTADGFIFISQAVENDARHFIEQTIGRDEAAARWYTHFHLGSDLDLMDDKEAVRPKVKAAFNRRKPIYLMVSTIEPRKNHVYLLDAFDALWAQGVDVCLCFVGRVGWKCEALVDRARSHPELNRRFFMFNDLSDAELEYCYKNAKSLVFPSHVEGFGLPIVEAMQRGLPAMASDIPVFREVGGEYCAYFSLDDVASLGELVKQFERSGKFPSSKPLQNWKWLSWKESTRQFLDRVITQLKRGPATSKKPASQTVEHS